MASQHLPLQQISLSSLPFLLRTNDTPCFFAVFTLATLLWLPLKVCYCIGIALEDPFVSLLLAPDEFFGEAATVQRGG